MSDYLWEKMYLRNLQTHGDGVGSSFKGKMNMQDTYTQMRCVFQQISVLAGL